MQNLTGRTAFVTGAASGIGLGIATALSQAGVKVMLCDIEEEALATAVEKLKLTNADVDGVRADVSLKAELQAAADATVARYGRVHILVNNAGVGGGRGYTSTNGASRLNRTTVILHSQKDFLSTSNAEPGLTISCNTQKRAGHLWVCLWDRRV
jgi:NAD(P)-dependent dehydrogenase (short-subunit alcohol dehydrogenase family)